MLHFSPTQAKYTPFVFARIQISWVLTKRFLKNPKLRLKIFLFLSLFLVFCLFLLFLLLLFLLLDSYSAVFHTPRVGGICQSQLLQQDTQSDHQEQGQLQLVSPRSPHTSWTERLNLMENCVLFVAGWNVYAMVNNVFDGLMNC